MIHITLFFIKLSHMKKFYFKEYDVKYCDTLVVPFFNNVAYRPRDDYGLIEVAKIMSMRLEDNPSWIVIPIHRFLKKPLWPYWAPITVDQIDSAFDVSSRVFKEQEPNLETVYDFVIEISQRAIYQTTDFEKEISDSVYKLKATDLIFLPFELEVKFFELLKK